MRRSGVEPIRTIASKRVRPRLWLAVVALVTLAAGIGYGVYRSTSVTLEEQPPMRPLSGRELSAYLRREQVAAGAYESMFVLPEQVEAWPGGAAEIAQRMHAESTRWSLEHTLPRELLTAEQTLALMAAHEGRVKLYPLESAVAMTALLRQRGSRAMVAEVWEIEGAEAPADPSGVLGYFVTAVYEDVGETPTAFIDPWGGGGEISPAGARVLRDTEVVGAALATEATRLFARTGDGSKALPMTEAALSLDPRSPSIREVHANVLAESGGVADGIRELQAAMELRPDAPRQLSLAQLALAQAGMLEMTGDRDAADAQFAEANRIVTQVLEQWPRYGRAHLALATIYLGSEDLARARVELETAQSLSPDAPMMWAGWAQYHLAEGDPTAASTKMKRAVELDPENWQLRLQAAQVFQAAGQTEVARASVAAALDMVVSEMRSKVREYAKRMIGPEALGKGEPTAAQGGGVSLDLPEPVVSAPPPSANQSNGPALMLGDPSKLKLRDPDQRLKLDLDQ
jgi:Flp pilus assembly protein TadD